MTVSDQEASRIFFETLLIESPIAQAFYDRDLHFRQVNQAFTDFTGLSADEHIGRHIQDVIPDLDPEVIPILHCILDGKQSSAEREITRHSLTHTDELGHWLAHYYPVRNGDGEVVGIGVMMLDVTERWRADEARERSESQLRLALDETHMGLWFRNLDTDEMRWSETCALLLGLDPLAPASSDLFQQQVHPEDRARLREALQKMPEDDRPYEESFRVIWPDGSMRWMLAKAQVSKESHATELVGILLDITETRAAQDERARLALRQARAGEQAVRMQRVTAALSEAVTVSQVCDVVLHEGCAVMGAPRGMITLLTEDHSEIESMRLYGYEHDKSTLINEELFDLHVPLSETLKTGNTVLLVDRDDIINNYPDAQPSVDQSETQAIASLPLASRGVVLGSWALTWTEPREFQEGEIIILLTLAAQASQALERARLYERERLIATSLQRTLLPKRLPSLRGATTAHRYMPSGDGVEVGGDWYDVLRFPDNRVALIIGDVGGHNIDSAAVMGQLRNAVRSYAWEGHPAAAVLEATNRLLCGLEPGTLATCCYVELNLDDGIAAVARAGHPPPLLINNNLAHFADIPADPPLGTEVHQKYEQSTLFLTESDTLVLYTDGLVETRAIGLTQGLQRLLSAAQKLAEDRDAAALEYDPETLADYLLKTLRGGTEREDDIAILIFRYEPTHAAVSHMGPRIIRRHLPSSATSAGVARRFAGDVMNDWGAPELSDMVSLCVSEIVTNALIHTATEVELVLRLSNSSVRVEVVDHSDRMPIIREGSDDDTSGRGLHIVDAISTEWGVDPYRTGKSVWFQIDRLTQSV